MNPPIFPCFIPHPLPPSSAKRPRLPLTTPICRLPLQPLRATAAALAAAILFVPAVADARTTVLSTNTILRRYVVTDSEAILRYALPLPSERLTGTPPPPIRRVQELLERLGVDLRARGAAGLIAGRRDLGKLREVIERERLDFLLDVPAKKRGAAANALSKLEGFVAQLEDVLGVSPSVGGIFPPPLARVAETVQDIMESRNSMSKRTNFDAPLVDALRKDALSCVSDIEELAVSGNGLPYRVPRRYNSYPRLIGRATVEMKLLKSGDGVWRDENSKGIGNEVVISAILDGYSAPLTAGNFVDIARRGYYNNTRVLASQRGFYLQLGEREDDNIEGFKDPKSGERRQIPMEIMVDGDPAPTYGGTLDELGIGDLQPMLPISAYGALAMVHSVENPNDASSQFYMFVLDPTSYQARSFGGSALTGSVSTFGYVDEGKQYLSQLEAGDKVAYVKTVAGEENFREYGDN